MQRKRPGDMRFPEGRHKLLGDHRFLSFECQPQEHAARLSAFNNATVSEWGRSPQCWAHQPWGRWLLAGSCSAYNHTRLVLLWKKIIPVKIWTGSGEKGILIGTILSKMGSNQNIQICLCVCVCMCESLVGAWMVAMSYDEQPLSFHGNPLTQSVSMATDNSISWFSPSEGSHHKAF